MEVMEVMEVMKVMKVRTRSSFEQVLAFVSFLEICRRPFDRLRANG
jgi:hypothetical protein